MRRRACPEPFRQGRSDGSRIGYEKVCKEEGKPVPENEVVKAFEWEKGETIEEPVAKKPRDAPDLMEALKASLEGVKGSTAVSDDDLSADIPGRADMTKDKLVEPLT